MLDEQGFSFLSEPFVIHISCFGPFGPATGHPRKTAEVSLTTTGGYLADILPEIAAHCLSESGCVPPPGYELGVFGGVSVYGGDSKICVGNMDDIYEATKGVPPPSSFANPSIHCMFLQPRSQEELANASLLTKRASVISGENMGQLVFVRRDKTSTSDPGAVLFPGASL